MLEHQLIKMLLNNDYYTKYKGLLTPQMFPDHLRVLYNTIDLWHSEVHRDASLSEIYTFLKVKNPVITEASLHTLEQLLSDINATEDIKDDIAPTIMEAVLKLETARQIGQAAANIINGSSQDLTEVRRLVSSADTLYKVKELNPVSTDINDILSGIELNTKWRFNLPPLAERVPGIGPGILTTIFARPEAGKTLTWVSLVAGPGGFASQGAKIDVYINEEKAVRTLARAVSAHCQMTIDEIRANPKAVQTKWNEIRDRLNFFDSVDMNMDELESRTRERKPDMIVVDQLDKVRIKGSFERDELKLRNIYIRAREICKQDFCLVGICQASAEAEGHGVLSYAMMEGSRTGKGAENDLIIGVGHNPAHDEEYRQLTLCKNKLTGIHDNFGCFIDTNLSTLRE